MSTTNLIQLNLEEFRRTFRSLLDGFFIDIPEMPKDSDTKAVKTKKIKARNQALLKQKDLTDKLQAFFLWGPPGIGKSQIIKEIADEMRLDLRDIRLPTLDAVDLRGLPMLDPENQQAVWLAPNFLPSHTPKGKRGGIIFFDEINAAAPNIQAAAYQITLDKKIGDYSLPPGWIVIAAGNRQGDKGVVYRLPSPLANRFTHIEIKVDSKSWLSWARREGIDPFVVSFIELGMSGRATLQVKETGAEMKKSALFGFDPKSNDVAFATPRSWEFVSNLRHLRDIAPVQYIDLVKGTVGKEAGALFYAFLMFRDELPDPERVLTGKSFAMPTKIDSMYIMISTLLEALEREFSVERVDNYFRMFVRQMEDTGRDDLATSAAIDLYERFTTKTQDEILGKSKECENWIENNAENLGLDELA